jgi:hypothetical protein
VKTVLDNGSDLINRDVNGLLAVSGGQGNA